ncbi:MAG: sulfite exporter TauE/SafE family protein [Chloroflexota bacterium]
MNELGSISIGAVIGLVLGALGGGGAILAVPALVYVLGAQVHAAVAASLAIVLVGAASGLVAYARDRQVAWRVALSLAAFGAVGAWAGAQLGMRVPGERLLLLLGVLMLGAAASMLRRPTLSARPVPRNPVAVAAAGLTLGLVTGFFGVGGGFLTVPVLLSVFGLAMRRAVGTSLAVISANSLGGLIGYLASETLDWHLLLLVSAGSLGGAVGGYWVARVLPERQLRRAFAGLVVLIAIYLMEKNLGAGWSAHAALDSPSGARAVPTALSSTSLNFLL